MTEATNLLRNIKPKDPAYRVVMDKITEFIQENLKEQEVKKLCNMPEIKYIGTDSYFIHYSFMPMLEASANGKLMKTALEVFKKYMETEHYRSIKTITTLDDQLSKIYAIDLVRRVSKKLLQELKNQLDNMSQQQLQQIMQMLMGAGSSGSQQGSQQQGQQPSGSTAVNQQGSQNQQNQQVSSDDVFDQLLNKASTPQGRQVLNQLINNINGNKLKQILGEAVKEAGETTEKANKIRRIMGGKSAGKSPGSLERIYRIATSDVYGIDEVISLANDLIKETGIFTKIVKKRSKFGDRVIGYYRTRDVYRAVPRDLALPEPLFTTKLINGFTAREKAIVSEGAFYVLIDKSGSMNGMKTIWARSVALALYNLAKKRKRKYYLRFFDYSVYGLIDDIERALEYILTIRSNGGTNITRALETALEDLSKHGLSNKTNTIIIITDGEDIVDEKLVEKFKKNNARLVAIMIDGYNDTLEKIAKETDGQFLLVEPTEEKALKIIELSKKK